MTMPVGPMCCETPCTGGNKFRFRFDSRTTPLHNSIGIRRNGMSEVMHLALSRTVRMDRSISGTFAPAAAILTRMGNILLTIPSNSLSPCTSVTLKPRF